MLASSLDQAGLWQEAVRLLQPFLPELPLPAWTLLLKAWSGHSWQHGLHLLLDLHALRPLRELPLLPDLAAVDVVLAACARRYAWKQALQCLQALGSLAPGARGGPGSLGFDSGCLLQALQACDSNHLPQQGLWRTLEEAVGRSRSQRAGARAASVHGLVVEVSWIGARGALGAEDAQAASLFRGPLRAFEKALRVEDCILHLISRLAKHG